MASRVLSRDDSSVLAEVSESGAAISGADANRDAPADGDAAALLIFQQALVPGGASPSHSSHSWA